MLAVFLFVAIIAALALLFSGKFLMTSILTGDKQFAVLETSVGDISIRLNHGKTPAIAKNFQEIARSGKYNNTIFHRVINGFMIQGGDYENSNGTGGTAWTGDLLPDEIVPEVSHVRGMVSMANRGPDTNGSQFFIVQKDAPFLDGRYSLFGEVVRGMEIVDQIASVATDANDRPLQPIVIEKIQLLNSLPELKTFEPTPPSVNTPVAAPQS